MLSSYGNIIFISVDCCRGDRLPAVAPWPHQKHPPLPEDFFLDAQLRRGVLFARVVAGGRYRLSQTPPMLFLKRAAGFACTAPARLLALFKRPSKSVTTG